MNKEAEILLDTALENLQEKLDFTGQYQPAPNEQNGGDAILIMKHNGKTLLFLIEIKKNVRKLHLHQLTVMRDKQKKRHPFLLVAGHIMPDARQELKTQGINYIEANGNAYLNAGGQFVFIEGAKPLTPVSEKTNRAFTKTGAKVVFLLLNNPEAANLTYRDIAAQAETGLGNVTNVMKGLKEAGFLLKWQKTSWLLTKKKELLAKWMDAYEHRLKPTLELGRFRFLDQQQFRKWEELALNSEQTQWGGEAAGAILTKYLQPGVLTLYTTETRQQLMKGYRLVPDENGGVLAYRKFWKDEQADTIVPPLLAYADLMITGDARCIETANMIYEQKLKPILE